MSKLQRLNQPPKFDFKLAKPHRILKDLERQKTRIPVTGFMHHIFVSRRYTSSLSPRCYKPSESGNDGLSLDEKSPKPFSTHKRLVPTTFSLKPPGRLATGGYGKGGKSSKLSKRIYQGQVESTEMPHTAARKPKKSILKPILNSPHRKFVSIKSKSSLTSRNRISAGGSKKRGPSAESPERSEQNQLEKSSISKPERDTPTRHASSVSFHEPVTTVIPAGDSEVRKPSSKPDHPPPSTVSQQEVPTKRDRKEVSPKEHRNEDTPKEHPKEDTKEKSVGYWKTPRIVVPRGENDKKVMPSDSQTKNKEQHPVISSSPSMYSIEQCAKSPERDYSEQAHKKSYIPYSRRMESGRSSRGSPDRPHRDSLEKYPTRSSNSFDDDQCKEQSNITTTSRGSPDCPHRDSLEKYPTRSSNSFDDDQCKKKSNITITFKNCQEVQHVKFGDSDSRGNSISDPNSDMKSSADGNCLTLVELTKQIAELNQKFENVTNCELPKIYQKLDSLEAKVNIMSEKCSDMKPYPEPNSNPERKEVPEPSPVCQDLTRKSKSEKCSDKKSGYPDLTRKPLSTCQFCQALNLPILKSFHRQLKETIGNRCFTDVLMSVFLRADNIYHVNVRELKNGSSLACFLVTDDGIVEAQRLGFFKEILTFSVIDVRNTLKPKNLALGITFELIDSERQKGGCDIINHGICMTCKPFLARTLGLSLDQLKYLYTNHKSAKNYPEKAIRAFRKHLSTI